MGFDVTQFFDTPGSPRVEVIPSITVGKIQENIAASDEVFVKQSTDATNPPGSDVWIIAARPIASWIIEVGVDTTLEILTTYNSLVYNHWKSFLLLSGTDNSMAGLLIPGWMCKMRLVNSSTTLPDIVAGIIKLQGVV